MKPLLKLLAVTLLTGAVATTSAQAQFGSPLRPSMPGTPALTLPPGVRPVPTTPPSFYPQPGIAPGGCYPPPRPYPQPVIDIDYKVMYRTCSRSPWQYYGKAETLREARYIERRLEALGYQVELVERFDRTPDR